MRLLLCVIAVILLTLTNSTAAPITLTADISHLSLEGNLKHFKDDSGELPFDQVRTQDFERLPTFRSLGYDHAAHWFRVELVGASRAPTPWIVVIGMPELEKVDVWVSQPDGSWRNYALGYHRPYGERPLQTRQFAVPINVSTPTDLYLRVRTSNAINITAELWQPNAFIANETRSNFGAGIYFGILVIATALYTLLAAWLRDTVLAAYAGYIASMALMNLGTAGFLPVLLESNAPWATDALPRIGWLGSAVSIVLMWDRLLNLQTNHIYIHRLYLLTIALNFFLLPFALMPSLVTTALLIVVKLANYLNVVNFCISMVLVLLRWHRTRHAELLMYFVAFLIPAVSTVITTTANQGHLPQNTLTSSIYQLAPLMHVLIMSLGLAMRLNQLRHDKVEAEKEASLSTQRSEEQRRFVAMLSHEFRNPLAAIDRSAQMIRIKMPEMPTSETHRLEQIRENVATLSGFVDNFLITEALDHGALALSPGSCAINQLLEAAVRLQGELAVERVGIQVNPEGASFELDSTLMGVAIGNLLANALRYSSANSPVELGACLNDSGLRIWVMDQGPGLSAEELGKLGTPYYRGTSSLGKKGSGLGYYFTRRIVEAHGGTLMARSHAGQDMQVEITLPHPMTR